MAWEPHHDVVASEDDVVIYELVLGDVNGNPTTVLERAHEHLKDNRLTPRGFSTQHVVYDTTAIVGGAFNDPNFNLNSEGEEGTGGDEVTYLLPEGWEEEPTLTIECTVWYQSMPPKWVAPMLQIQGDSLIDGFRELYAEFVPTPERIATVTLAESTIGVFEAEPMALSAYPNPSRGEGVTIVQSNARPLGRYQLIDATGKLVEQGDCPQPRLRLQLPASGRYNLRTESGGSVSLIRE